MSIFRRNRKTRAQRLLATLAGLWTALKAAQLAVKAAVVAVPVAAGAAAAAALRKRGGSKTDFGGVNDGAESHQPPVQRAAHAQVG